MPSKVYLRVLQGGLAVSLFIVFLVFQDLLFPYITSKQLTFNVLMEILLAVWLVFIWRYPAYRPKKSLITAGLAAYFIAILVSCFVSVDVNLSFWGDAERMLGLFHLFHFLIFYLILITVFRSWRDWEMFLTTSVIIAAAISLIGLFGPDVYSRIGNTAYVSGYLIFNLYFCLLLFFRSGHKLARWAYFLPAVIMLLEFRAARTSGAIIGLSFSLLLLVFLVGLFHQKKIWRRTSVITFLVAVIAVIFVFSQHNAAWFQNSFLKNLTTKKPTFQTRLISWQGAAKDFKYHPLFGTGFGNYAVIFDKHFDSKFFNYSKTETYFDRAHNNLIDIVSTTGLVGLIAYLSIFVFVIYYLAVQMRRHGWRLSTGEEPGRKNLEAVVIIALIVAYFIQNLAVFDSFVTYVGLMITLGYVYWVTNEDQLALDNADDARSSSGNDSKLVTEIVVLIILLVAAGLFANRYNLRPWRMFRGVIKGYAEVVQGNFSNGLALYQKALVGTPLDHDGRVTLINLTFSNISQIAAVVPEAELGKALDYVVGLAQKNAVTSPLDSLTMMQLAQMLDAVARFNYDNPNKFDYYSQLAIQAMDKSIESSPGRAPLYWVKAQMLLMRGQEDLAIQTLEYGISLNPEYSEGYCRLAQFNLFLEKEDLVIAPLEKCLDLGGAAEITSEELLSTGLAYYSDKKDYDHSIQLAERLTMIYNYDPNAWINLAKLYLIVGNQEKADLASQYAISLKSDLTKEWAEFLNTMDNAATPTPEQK
ncbi:MAG: O-antigen ligase family protein [Patescibacteria group bacterium]|jgi:O-antigen ligase